MNIPSHLRYTETHEWVGLEGDVATIGITDHAQQELSDVVFLDPPKVGFQAKAKAPVAVVESVKAASDIYAPVAGEVIEVNPALAQDPSLLNRDPHGQGWIWKMKVANPADVQGLKDAAAYQKQIGA